MNIGVLCSLLSALLFGISTPFANLLVGAIAPLMLAGGTTLFGQRNWLAVLVCGARLITSRSV